MCVVQAVPIHGGRFPRLEGCSRRVCAEGTAGHVCAGAGSGAGWVVVDVQTMALRRAGMVAARGGACP